MYETAAHKRDASAMAEASLREADRTIIADEVARLARAVAEALPVRRGRCRLG